MGNAIKQNENNLRTTTSKYDALNRQIQATTASGGEILNTYTSYDAIGNILSAKDANGNITQYQYDELNRRKKVIDAKLQDTDYTYDAVGNLKEVIDTPTRKIIYTYDALNRRTDVKDAEGIVTHTKYNEFGNKVAVTENYTGIINDPNARTTQSKYDKLGRKVQSIDPLNKATITTYDEANNVRSVTDANQNTTRYDYDSLNRQTRIIDANGITTQITTYDGFGNVKSISDAGLDPNNIQDNNKTKYEYDQLNRLTTTIDPRTKQTIQSYDGLGRVNSITNRNQQIRTFAYDINDNLLTETWDNGTTINYTYDKVGNLQTSQDSKTNTNNTYTYDDIYQLTDSGTSSSNVKFHYTYDQYGDLTQRQDSVNGLTTATLNHTYNNNHQQTGLTQSGAGIATQNIRHSYDRLSQLTQVDRQSSGNSGHLITDYQYDPVGRIVDINNRFNTTVISHDAYSYDSGSRLTGKTGNDGNSTVGYGKDNQISTVAHSNQTDEAYNFNALGIRAGWVTDPQDSRRVLSDGKYQYQYDDEGNLTQKREVSTGKMTNYEWDYRNRLVKVSLSDGSRVDYGYDAEDRRTSKKVTTSDLQVTTSEKYVYDGADIALVVDGAGVLVERYLFGAGVDNVLSREKGGAVVWSLADRQGSVVDLVDQNGAVLNHFAYDSFGQRTQTTGVEFRFGYTGRELDAETGLYYYRARYYDPMVGRFVSEDPIGFGAGDPNLYRYVGNNATNFTDPSGLLWANLGAGLLNVAIDAGLQLLLKGEIDDIGSLGVSFATGFIGVGLADKGGKLLSASRSVGQVATKYKYATSIATNAFVDGGVGATVQVGSNIVTGKNWSENVWETSTSQALFGAVGNTITLGAGVAWNKYRGGQASIRATGSGHIIGDPDPGALEKYAKIIASTDDIQMISLHTGIDENVLSQVKRHLFIKEHNIAIGGNKVVKGNFAAYDSTADIWNAARRGFTPRENIEKNAFSRIVPHEYIESQLMEAGIPYYSSHPSVWKNGKYRSNPKHFGAHDLSVNMDNNSHPFAHWESRTGLSIEDLDIPNNLSLLTKDQLDDIVESILAKVKDHNFN